MNEEKPLHKRGDGRDYTLLYLGMDLPRINYEENNGKPYRYVEIFSEGLTNLLTFEEQT